MNCRIYIILFLLLLILYKLNIFNCNVRNVKETFVTPNHEYDIDKIYEVPNFLTEEECKQIIELAKPELKRSKVIGESGDDISKIRTSYQAWIDDRENPIVKKISELAKKYTGLPEENQEDLQVLRYKEGQEYRPHYDACHPDEDANCKDDIKKGGLRYATVIVYLNDDFDEGGTVFPNRDFTVQPETGKAAIFYNLTEDNKKPAKKAYHGGLPVKNGEKWMCNFWIRLDKFV